MKIMVMRRYTQKQVWLVCVEHANNWSSNKLSTTLPNHKLSWEIQDSMDFMFGIIDKEAIWK